MDYKSPLKYHYKAKGGWMNDPNGLVYFNGYYHVFYQHAPHHSVPWKEPMHWGHARTKDFIEWEELPVALTPSEDYDKSGCWSGTAIVKDGRLYLFYTGITAVSVIAVAVSDDGVNFQKYEQNPVIATYPEEGGPDFRDPAVCCIDGVYYCIVASGHIQTKTARLLLYRSENLFDWEFLSVVGEWEASKYAECPSILPFGKGGVLISCSVCRLDETHFFQIMTGRLENGKFVCELSDSFDKGPDQYAGQVFAGKDGMPLLMTWIPGWKYAGFVDGYDIGCLSVPRKILVENGRICGAPADEVAHLLKREDPAVEMNECGFTVAREKQPPLIHKGEVRDIAILRDGYILEIFVNGGETVYSLLLC